MSLTVEFQPNELRRFDPRAAEVIGLAWVLGWRVRWINNKRKSVVLSTGDQERNKTITVPSTNINANRVASSYRQLFQYTEPQVIADLALGKMDVRNQPEPVQRIVTLLGTRIYTYAAEHLERRDPDLAARLLSPQREDPVPTKNPRAPLGNNVGDAIREAEQRNGAAPKHVASRKTFLASRNGKEYPSDIIDVITYTDGSIAYGCKRCDFVTDKSHLSVRSHSVNVHKGEGQPDWKAIDLQRAAAKAKPEPKPEPAKPTPRSIAELAKPIPPAEPAKPVVRQEAPLHGITLLTHHVRTALRAGAGQPRDVAVHLLELDPLVRMEIATLILNGHQFEQLRTAADEAIALAKLERDAERDRADKLQGDLRALKDILGSIQ